MKKTILSSEIVHEILTMYRSGSTLNNIVTSLGVARRAVERTLKENGEIIKTKSQILKNRFPILKDKEELHRMYHVDLMSLEEIAHEIGTNTQVVKTAFKDQGISTLDQGLKRILKNTPKSLQDPDFLNSEYVDNKRSVNSLAIQFGVSDTSVKTMLNRFGIVRRSHSQQMANNNLNSEQLLNAKIGRRLRSRLSNALVNGQKSGSAVRDLGCSIEYLKKHLESQFQADMSWDNYGRNGWHIDHIKPLASFDLTDREQFLKANHYTNLQPLWAIENWKKSNKVKDTVKMYIVCGPCGSGKSYVCRNLNLDNFEHVDSDKVPKEQHYYHFRELKSANINIIYDPLRKPVTILNRYKNEFNIDLFVIDETEDVIYNRILARGGKPNIDNIRKALNKVDRWKRAATFSGTSQQVLEYLQSQL